MKLNVKKVSIKKAKIQGAEILKNIQFHLETIQ